MRYVLKRYSSGARAAEAGSRRRARGDMPQRRRCAKRSRRGAMPSAAAACARGGRQRVVRVYGLPRYPSLRRFESQRAFAPVRTCAQQAQAMRRAARHRMPTSVARAVVVRSVAVARCLLTLLRHEVQAQRAQRFAALALCRASVQRAAQHAVRRRDGVRYKGASARERRGANPTRSRMRRHARCHAKV